MASTKTRHQTLAYNTLDVFTTTPFAGNQLGLVHVPASHPLSEDQKQTLTIEFNYSETVILHHPSSDSNNSDHEPGTYHAQIFTPKSELPFAGHPTIGVATWIFNNLEPNRDSITIHLKAGPVHATFDRANGIASAAIPHDVRVHSGTASWDRVVASQPGLGNFSALKDSKTPIASVVPGMNFALIDLSADPEALNHIVPTKNDIPRNEDLDSDRDGAWRAADPLMANVFYHILPAQDGDGEDVIRIRQRVMVIDLEDPATGAASAALTAYLALQRGGAGRSYRFEIDQGVEMGRASKIFVAVTLKGDGKAVEKIELSGQAVEVMSGQIRIA